MTHASGIFRLSLLFSFIVLFLPNLSWADPDPIYSPWEYGFIRCDTLHWGYRTAEQAITEGISYYYNRYCGDAKLAFLGEWGTLDAKTRGACGSTKRYPRFDRYHNEIINARRVSASYCDTKDGMTVYRRRHLIACGCGYSKAGNRCVSTELTEQSACKGPILGVSTEKNQGRPYCSAGNPINIGTANKFQSETDYASRSAGGAGFARYYNSQDGTEGSLGIAWRHGYERRLNISSDAINTVRPDGRIYTFTLDTTGWGSDPDVTETLEAIAGGWTYTTEADTQETYDVEGRLLTITDRAGRTQTLSYDAEGRLTSVIDAYGRSLQFAYDSEGHLATLTDPDGTVTSYQYTDDRLTGVIYADGVERHYQYGNADYPNALSAIVDGTGNTIAAWSYDENGWATASTHAGGADDTQVAYNGDDSVTVTNPLGKQTTYHFQVYHGVPKVVSVEGHATASCEGANRAYEYDDSGFLIAKTDWRGTVTTYARDAKGRERSRTEAVGTPQERTVTTEWHPEYNEPVRITEPGQVTEFTYNADGRLTGRTTAATE